MPRKQTVWVLTRIERGRGYLGRGKELEPDVLFDVTPKRVWQLRVAWMNRRKAEVRNALFLYTILAEGTDKAALERMRRLAENGESETE